MLVRGSPQRFAGQFLMSCEQRRDTETARAGCVGTGRYRHPVIVKRVTQVALSRTTEPTPSDHMSFLGTELWRVQWTELRNGKPTELR